MMKQRKSSSSSPDHRPKPQHPYNNALTLLPLTTQPQRRIRNRSDDVCCCCGGGGGAHKAANAAWIVFLLLIIICTTIALVATVVWFLEVETQETELEYYIPVLRSNRSNVKEDWPWGNVIHIVNTRLMQEQGSLLALGEARLALFRVFCLPTMRQQSTNQFLWIIKVDPDLDPRLLRQLVHDVREHFSEDTTTTATHNNAYVVGSNQNFRINEKFPGAWRDGAEIQDLLRSRIYTGDRSILEMAMAYSDDFPILETRLDADDGLHIQFIETVQKMALQQFAHGPRLQWMYWCSRRHIEWHWMDNYNLLSSSEHNKPTSIEDSLWTMVHTYGTVLGIQHSKLCITPGITTGFALGTREADVPVFAHDELIQKIQGIHDDPTDNNHHHPRAPPDDEDIPGCGLANRADCLQFVEELVFEAIRSRTPTSAGMARVQITDTTELYDQWWIHLAFWNMIHQSFRISRPTLKWIHQYLSDHLIAIAHDNLIGQCTTGHSCKESAKQELERLIQSRQRQPHRTEHAFLPKNTT